MAVPRPRPQIQPGIRPHQSLLIHRLPLEGRAEEGRCEKGNSYTLELQHNTHYSLITDTITEMEWWACFQPKDQPSHRLTPFPPPNVAPVLQPSTKKSMQKSKDKHKRKL